MLAFLEWALRLVWMGPAPDVALNVLSGQRYISHVMLQVISHMWCYMSSLTCDATCHLGPALHVIPSSTCEVRYVAGAVAGVGRASGHSDGADAERGDGGSETTQPSRVLPASLLEDVHLGCLPHTMSTTQRQYQTKSTAIPVIPVCCAWYKGVYLLCIIQGRSSACCPKTPQHLTFCNSSLNAQALFSFHIAPVKGPDTLGRTAVEGL